MPPIANAETVSPSDDARKVERWALSLIADRMQAARESGGEADILASCRLNWRLWTIFQAALLDGDCPWPAEQRGALLSLASFVDRQSGSVIAFPDGQSLDPLISLNRTLAAGLADSLAAG